MEHTTYRSKKGVCTMAVDFSKREKGLTENQDQGCQDKEGNPKHVGHYKEFRACFLHLFPPRLH